jgi:hypothetical protein
MIKRSLIIAHIQNLKETPMRKNHILNFRTSLNIMLNNLRNRVIELQIVSKKKP